MRSSFSSQRIRHYMIALITVIATMPGTSAWAITCGYDALGRLTKITYDNGSYVVYQYDAAGNCTVVAATRL